MDTQGDSGSVLTTGQLAELTGVPAGTLRMWESRHGFPVGTRLPSGRRRYSERDVELVRSVLHGREQGLSLRAAIGRAGDHRPPSAPSIFAGLTERRPDLQPIRLDKWALLALTRAIEDEHYARGRSGVLIGSFQTEAFYRRSEPRWRELARTATLAIALAEFEAAGAPPGSPHEVPISREHPLAREWALVFQAPEACTCLAGWEVPRSDTGAGPSRSFEVIWSPEPEAAQVAMTIVAELTAPLAPELSAQLQAAAAQPSPRSTPELRSATSQVQRMLSYLAGAAVATR